MPISAQARRIQTSPQFRLAIIAALALTMASCSRSTLNLMPTPLVHQYLGAEVYSKLPSEQRSPNMEIFYATNRPGSGAPTAREYGNGIVEQLQLGTATMRLGARGINWRDVIKFSTLQERQEEVPLHLERTEELDSLPSTGGETFAARINQTLANLRRPDITIYIHGASSSFFRAAAQGAQLHHFMTRDTALLAYSWPSTGRFISYQKDVELAAQSADNLADLIEFLAANTKARRVNLLIYSAGGQVAGPALTNLRMRYPDTSGEALKKRFRIGDVYFAAADVGQDKFIDDYLPTFSDIVENTTVTVHKEDPILKIAQRSHKGESRLGKPDRERISDEQIRLLEGLAKQGKLDVIDMKYSTAERSQKFKVHGYWYLNEWVSSDAILQLLLHQPPADRGLERRPGSEAWYFPPDYPERLEGLIREARVRDADEGA